MSKLQVAICISCLLYLAACSQRGQWADWSLYSKDPTQLIMNSRIVDPQTSDELSWPQLIELARSRDIILIGETHDNPYHHLLQSQVIFALRSVGRPLSVGFEQFSWESPAAKTSATLPVPKRLSKLRQISAWDRSGWPEWKFYEPVFRAAFEVGAKVFGLDLTPEEIKDLRISGKSPFDNQTLSQASFQKGLQPISLMKDLVKELEEMHPGKISEPVLEKMQLIQRSRDLQMSLQILKHFSDKRLVVGILGLGHARKDRAVPYYLKKLNSRARVLSLCLGDRVALAQRGYGKEACDLIIETPTAVAQASSFVLMRHRRGV